MFSASGLLSWITGAEAEGTANVDQPASDLTAHELFGPLPEFSACKAAFLAHTAGDYGYGALHEPVCSPCQQQQAKQQQQQLQQQHRHQLQQQQQPRPRLTIDAVRVLELRRLHGQAYLDHGGSALYSELQLDAALSQLKATLMTNPHSGGGGGGGGVAAAGDELRRLTLQMLHAPADDYVVVLTSGATAAIKLVGECLPWSVGGSSLSYTLHNHNSVLGLRELALRGGAKVHVVDFEDDAGMASAAGAVAGPAGAAVAEAAAPAASRRIPARLVHCHSMLRHAGPTLAMAAAAHSCDEPAGARGTQASGNSSSSSSGPDSCQSASSSGSGSDGLRSGPSFRLLALPLECNFSGRRYDLGAAMEAAAGACLSGNPGSGSRSGSGSGSGEVRSLVLIDAAKACATSPPDLSVHPVDFVTLSYYKIFGYPTGLGALVVRRDALSLLTANKAYFSGGTVLAAAADSDWVQRRPGPAGLEDGTLPFAGIAAAAHGFALIRRLGGFPAIGRHTGCLAQHLASGLAALRHGDGGGSATGGGGGGRVVELYGWDEGVEHVAGLGADASLGHSVSDGSSGRAPQRGPTVTFNLLRPDGQYVGYGEVRTVASLHGLHLRYGSHCNPGACAKMLQLDASELRDNFEAGHVCWDDRDLSTRSGRPTGAIRASLGALSTFEEVHLLLQLLRRYFVAPAGSPTSSSSPPLSDGRRSVVGQPSILPASAVLEPLHTGGCGPHLRGATARRMGSAEVAGASADEKAGKELHRGTLTHMFVYPIKSCAGQQVPAWPIGPNGLLYDREWVLLEDDYSGNGISSGTGTGTVGSGGGGGGSSSGRVLTQKLCPRMALVRPSIDLQRGTLTLDAPECPGGSLVVRLGPCLGYRGRGGASGDATGKETVRVLQKAEQGPLEPDGGSGGGSLLSSGDNSSRSSSSCGIESGGVEKAASGVSVVTADAVTNGNHATTCSASRGARMCSPSSGPQPRPQIAALRVCGDSVCGWVEQVKTVTIVQSSCSREEAVTGASVDLRPDLDPIREWFRQAIGIPCRLVRQVAGAREARAVGAPSAGVSVAAAALSTAGVEAAAAAMVRDVILSASSSPLLLQEPSAPGGLLSGGSARYLGFANDGQYMLLNAASLDDLNARLAASGRRSLGQRQQQRQGGSGGGGPSAPLNERHFRPNLVIAGFSAYEEDEWSGLQIGPAKLGVLGSCPRCDMVSVDQATGTRGKPDVLLELAQYRRGRGGKMHFGVLLAAAEAAAATACASGGRGRRCGEGGAGDKDGDDGGEPQRGASCGRGGCSQAASGSPSSGPSGGLAEEYLASLGSVILRVGDRVESQCR